MAPLIYLVVAHFLAREISGGEGVNDMVAYILLIVALAQGALVKVIERFQVQSYRKNPQASATPAQFFVTVSIISMAVIESIYLFGLVVFILSGDYLHLARFYIIGIGWTLCYWPRRTKFESFVQEMQIR
ncbi:MAG: hypothetical protein GY847_23515 [Proteobacteria bacterium]|nr:hypothetical protein [Pseudomonadota bacterium]